MVTIPAKARQHRMLLLTRVACALALPVAGLEAAQGAQGALASHSGQAPGAAALESAALEQCVTSVTPTERAVSFFGEMAAVPGTARMAMRIDLQERLPGDFEYRTLSAPGLSVWRSSDPKVKVYKYVKQVTNLYAPARYRALVRFRWLNARGRVLKHTLRVTGTCEQPAAPPPEATTPPTEGASKAPAGTA
jgi:hypothetical protein